MGEMDNKLRTEGVEAEPVNRSIAETVFLYWANELRMSFFMRRKISRIVTFSLKT
jgi:hypothetical protein